MFANMFRNIGEEIALELIELWEQAQEEACREMTAQLAKKHEVDQVLDLDNVKETMEFMRGQGYEHSRIIQPNGEDRNNWDAMLMITKNGKTEFIIGIVATLFTRDLCVKTAEFDLSEDQLRKFKERADKKDAERMN
jgi:hypothetical protein